MIRGRSGPCSPRSSPFRLVQANDPERGLGERAAVVPTRFRPRLVGRAAASRRDGSERYPVVATSRRRPARGDQAARAVRWCCRCDRGVWFRRAGGRDQRIAATAGSGRSRGPTDHESRDTGQVAGSGSLGRGRSVFHVKRAASAAELCPPMPRRSRFGSPDRSDVGRRVVPVSGERPPCSPRRRPSSGSGYRDHAGAVRGHGARLIELGLEPDRRRSIDVHSTSPPVGAVGGVGLTVRRSGGPRQRPAGNPCGSAVDPLPAPDPNLPALIPRSGARPVVGREFVALMRRNGAHHAPRLPRGQTDRRSTNAMCPRVRTGERTGSRVDQVPTRAPNLMRAGR
jgi:hypothetical protein